MIGEIKIQKLNCNRCGHIWIPRKVPCQCPKCHSYFWNEDKDFDRRKKEFKDEQFKLKKIRLSTNAKYDGNIETLNEELQGVTITNEKEVN